MLSAFRAICIAVLMLVPAIAVAGGNDWVVAKATSQVTYSLDTETWTPLKSGEVVPNAAWISTGSRGRVQLVRGVESIAFQPNTRAAIVTKGFFIFRKTVVTQQKGTLDLEIEKRILPHTTVQTPHLAAVVKGTIFHVAVGRTTASVSVDRGLVQVTSFASRQRANVGAGQRASVNVRRGMSVAAQGAESAPSVKTVSAAAAGRAVVSTDAIEQLSSTTSTSSSQAAAASSSSSAKAGNVNENASAKASSAKSGNNGKSASSSSSANSGQSNKSGSPGNSGNSNSNSSNGNSGKGNNGRGHAHGHHKKR